MHKVGGSGGSVCSFVQENLEIYGLLSKGVELLLLARCLLLSVIPSACEKAGKPGC